MFKGSHKSVEEECGFNMLWNEKELLIAVYVIEVYVKTIRLLISVLLKAV